MALFELEKQQIPTQLNEKYIVPPFSVFNTHQTYWKVRTKLWNDMGIGGTNGRVTGMNGLSYDNRRMDKHKDKPINGTSTFSPVVAEVMYKWFTTPHSHIFDPFAGGITRGVVAAVLGHFYVGTDINPTQVSSNNEEWLDLRARWLIDGDCEWLEQSCLDYKCKTHPDFILTCPPYYNLERYTDLDDDMSNAKTYEDFLKSYVNCIDICYNILCDDSFMVWVVSDVRNKTTTEYYGLVADTIKACQNVGFKFYNEIILYNDTGNLAIVSGDYLDRARKVGRQHQNILVFYKGNVKHIRDKFGNVI